MEGGHSSQSGDWQISPGTVWSLRGGAAPSGGGKGAGSLRPGPMEEEEGGSSLMAGLLCRDPLARRGKRRSPDECADAQSWAIVLPGGSQPSLKTPRCGTVWLISGRLRGGFFAHRHSSRSALGHQQRVQRTSAQFPCQVKFDKEAWAFPVTNFLGCASCVREEVMAAELSYPLGRFRDESATLL